MIANFMVERQCLNPCAALCGGNWNNGDDAGVFNANPNNPDNTNSNNGFRCPETAPYFWRRESLYLPGSEAKSQQKVSELPALSPAQNGRI